MKENMFFYKNFLDMSQTSTNNLFKNVHYPWEVLPHIKEYIVETGKNLSKDEFDEIKENVWVSKKSSVSPTSYIGGPTIIYENTEVRHCAFIRGSVIIGKNCVIGNSTEVKNAILFNNVQIPHFNYVGDSILGYRAHLGAGSIISNVKSDKSNVSVKYGDKKINTELRKFGAIVGDFVEIGCNAVLNPGTIVGRNSSIYPTSMARGTIRENVIFKNSGKIVDKL